MKRVEIGLRGVDDPLHPLVPFLTGEDVERAAMVDWNGVTRSDESDESTVVIRAHADPDVVRDAFASEPLIDTFDLSVVGERCCYIHAHSQTAELEGTTAKALTPPGVVVVPPIHYEDDGWLSLTLVGDDAAVQRAVDRVPESVRVDVRTVDSRGYDASDPFEALSARQREAVLAALDVGYYETPRTSDVDAVAHELDCAPSTAAEHLRKAESRLLRQFARDATTQ